MRTFLTSISAIFFVAIYTILITLNNIAIADTLDFELYNFTVDYPDTWIKPVSRYQNAEELQSVARISSNQPAARLMITVEQRLNHDDAVNRLRQIDAEEDAPATFLDIGGWPALERHTLVPASEPGLSDPDTGRELVWKVTTAVAADDLLVRVQGILQPEADTILIDEIEAIGRSLRFDSAPVTDTEASLQQLRQAPRIIQTLPEKSFPQQESSSITMPKNAADSGLNLRINAGGGVDSEIEIAASTDGQHIVVANNSRDYQTSNDGGLTFSAPNIAPVPPGGTANGDPSLAFGASGSFYFAYIGFPAAGQCSTGITRSDDNGQMFNFIANATICNDAGIGNAEPNTACFPDQEHIAADRFNTSLTGGDQVYSTWRDFTGGGCGPANTPTAIGGPEVPSLVCSSDSGQNWTAKIAVGNANDNYPRITVGQDGFVYVVYRAGNNIMLHKYSSCDNGLAAQAGFPMMIAGGIADVSCGAAGAVPGLDRCNSGSNLSSHTVAVDDTNANHIYAAYAVNTTPGVNENVLVQDSLDGGATWPAARTVQINNGQIGRRFMPWACSVGGDVYVSWYDMRAAFGTPNSGLPNDLADFYGARAFVNGNGDLQAGEEFRISEVSDALCASGWPAAPRNQNDSEQCGVQPQLAGICQDAMGNNQAAPNQCDFSDCGGAGANGGGLCQCNAGFVCNLGRGVPKYGDYNGNACAAGRFYTAWASATSPPSMLPASTDIDVFFNADLVCCEPQIQVPSNIDFGTACGTATQAATLEVCNTGKEDLAVTSITSDDPQFAVTTPLSGYPVTISPDFCFPFEATFSPAGSGNASAMLSIASNDPVSPSLAVTVSGSVGVAAVETFIADSGEFGNVCSGDLKDLNLTIQSNGSCPLEIDSIGLLGLDAADFEIPDGGFAGTIIEPGNSLLVPVRFTPVNFTDPSPRTALVEVESRTKGGDPLTPDQTPIEGTVPPPDINVAIANSGDFGAVCPGDQADLDLTLFNQGMCDLTITDISSNEPLFELSADLQLPLVLSPDADFSLPIRFAPDMCSDTPVDGTITINSDSPGEEMLEVMLSGVSPCPNLVIDPAELSGLHAFPATVVDTTGTLGCFSERNVTLRNNGACPLTLDSISAAGADFSVTAPTVFPVILPSGEETLEVTLRFTPQADADPLAPSEVTGLLTIVSDDPDFPHTADLCGESVAQSGVRILVTDISSGLPVPIDEVDSISIQSKGKNRPSPINLHFKDQPLSSTVICGNSLDYHVDQETLPSAATTGSNPKSSYQAKAKEGNLQTSESFELGQCDFHDVQLQLQDSNSPICLLLPKGAACTTDGECCSGKCNGPSGAKSCK